MHTSIHPLKHLDKALAVLAVAATACLLALAGPPGALAAQRAHLDGHPSASAPSPNQKPSSLSPRADHYGAFPATALATFTTIVDTDFGAVHRCASNTCPGVRAPRGTVVTSYCYVSGQVLSNTSWWDLVLIDPPGPNSGSAGFINEHWLSNEGQNTHC